MRGTMPTGKAALFMALLLGAALAGSTALNTVASAHSTCGDLADNDGDVNIDEADAQCLVYPWADGAGEKVTTIGVTQGENGNIAGSMEYPSTAFVYWLGVYQDQDAQGFPQRDLIAQCNLAGAYTDPIQYVHQNVWDDSIQDALDFLNDPANGCPP